jgi:xanthine dehydrogenase accessory factor
VRRELLDLASDLAGRGQPFALATVVARTPPISAQVGDTALVTGDGRFFGWVGGSCTRPTVIAESAKAIADGRPRLVALDPHPEGRARPGLTVFLMTCHSGGSVEIHIQPVLPAPRLLVYGVSPTARALCRLGKAMGYTVEVVDPAAEAADFPDADAVHTSAAAAAARAQTSSAPLYAVVATQGQWDEEAAAAALALEPAAAYLGVMASRKRFGEMRDLLADAAPPAALARVKNPAGLDLHAELPEEIALSILAEIVAGRRAAATAATTTTAATATTAAAPPAAAPAPRRLAQAAQARDPVCGMMVDVATAQHRATVRGREYFFCCGGCKQRFVAAPDKFLDAGGGA